MEAERAASISVLVVDDHAVFAESLRAAFADVGGISVAGLASDGIDAVRTVRALHPDVVLVADNVPDLDLEELVRTAHEALERAVVVLFASSGDDRGAVAAFDAGAAGYLTKDMLFPDVVAGIRSAVRGERVVAPHLTHVLPRAESGPPADAYGLTPRELEVLALVCNGLTNKAIAGQLFVSLHTIRNHVANILGKLGAHSKLEAASIALREGIIESSAPPLTERRA